MGRLGRLVKSTFGIKKLGNGKKSWAKDAAHGSSSSRDADVCPVLDSAPSAATVEPEPTAGAEVTAHFSTATAPNDPCILTPQRPSLDPPRWTEREDSTPSHDHAPGNRDGFVQRFIDGVPTPTVQTPLESSDLNHADTALGTMHHDSSSMTTSAPAVENPSPSRAPRKGGDLSPDSEAYVPGWRRNVGTMLTSSEAQEETHEVTDDAHSDIANIAGNVRVAQTHPSEETSALSGDSRSIDADEVDEWIEESTMDSQGKAFPSISTFLSEDALTGVDVTDDRNGKEAPGAVNSPMQTRLVVPEISAVIDDDGMPYGDASSSLQADDSASELFSVEVGSPLLSPSPHRHGIRGVTAAREAAELAASMREAQPTFNPSTFLANPMDLDTADISRSNSVDVAMVMHTEEGDAIQYGIRGPPTPLPRHDAVIPSNIARRAAKRQARAMARAAAGATGPGCGPRFDEANMQNESGVEINFLAENVSTGNTSLKPKIDSSGAVPKAFAITPDSAAVRLQAFARGCLARAEVARKRATLRAAAIRREQECETAAAVKIQAAIRGRIVRGRLNAMRQTYGQRWHLEQWQQVVAIEAELVELRRVASEAAAAGVVSKAPEIQGNWRRGGVSPVTSYRYRSPATAPTPIISSSGRRRFIDRAGTRAAGGRNSTVKESIGDAWLTSPGRVHIAASPSSQSLHAPSHQPWSKGTPAIPRVRVQIPSNASIRSGIGISSMYGSAPHQLASESPFATTSLCDGSPNNSSSSDDGDCEEGTFSYAQRITREQAQISPSIGVSSISPGSRIVAAAEDLTRRYHSNPMWGFDDYSPSLRAAASVNLAASTNTHHVVEDRVHTTETHASYDHIPSSMDAGSGWSPGGSSAASWSPSVRGLVKSPQGSMTGEREADETLGAGSTLPMGFSFAPMFAPGNPPGGPMRKHSSGQTGGGADKKRSSDHDDPPSKEHEEPAKKRSEMTTIRTLDDGGIESEATAQLSAQSRSHRHSSGRGRLGCHVTEQDTDMKDVEFNPRGERQRRSMGVVSRAKRLADSQGFKHHPRVIRRCGALTWAAAIAVGASAAAAPWVAPMITPKLAAYGFLGRAHGEARTSASLAGAFITSDGLHAKPLELYSGDVGGSDSGALQHRLAKMEEKIAASQEAIKPQWHVDIGITPSGEKHNEDFVVQSQNSLSEHAHQTFRTKFGDVGKSSPRTSSSMQWSVMSSKSCSPNTDETVDASMALSTHSGISSVDFVSLDDESATSDDDSVSFKSLDMVEHGDTVRLHERVDEAGKLGSETDLILGKARPVETAQTPGKDCKVRAAVEARVAELMTHHFAAAKEIKAALIKAWADKDVAEKRLAEATSEMASLNMRSASDFKTKMNTSGEFEVNEVNIIQSELEARIKREVDDAVSQATAELTMEASRERRGLENRIASLNEELQSLHLAHQRDNAMTETGLADARSVAALQGQLEVLTFDLALSRKKNAEITAKVVAAELAAQEAEEVAKQASLQATAAEARAMSAEESLVTAAQEAMADSSMALQTSGNLDDEVRGLKRTISLAEKQCQISIDQQMIESRDKHNIAITSLNSKLADARLQITSLEQAKEKLEAVNHQHNVLQKKHREESENLRSKLRGVEAKLRDTQDWLDKARAQQARAESAAESARVEGRKKIEEAKHSAEMTQKAALDAEHFKHEQRMDAVLKDAEVRVEQALSERDEALAVAVAAQSLADALERERDEATGASRAATSAVTQIEKQREDTAKEVAALKEQLAKIIQERDEVRLKADKAIQDARDETTKALRDAEMAAVTAKAEASSAISKARADAAAAATRDALHDAALDKIALEERLVNSESTVVKLRSDLTEARAQSAKAQSEANAALAMMKDAQENRSDEMSELLEAARASENTANAAMIKLKDERDGLKQKLSDAQSSRKTLENDKSDLLRMLKSLEFEKSNLEYQLKQVTEQQAIAEAATSSRDLEEKSKAAMLSEVTAARDAAEVNLAAANAAAEFAAADLASHKSKLLAITAERDKLLSEITSIKTQAAAAAAAAAHGDDTRTHLERTRKELDEEKNRSAVLQAELESATDALVKSTTRAAATNINKASTEIEVSRLKRELDVEKGRVSSLVAQLEAAEERLRSSSHSLTPASNLAADADTAVASDLRTALADKSRLLSSALMAAEQAAAAMVQAQQQRDAALAGSDPQVGGVVYSLRRDRAALHSRLAQAEEERSYLRSQLREATEAAAAMKPAGWTGAPDVVANIQQRRLPEDDSQHMASVHAAEEKEAQRIAIEEDAERRQREIEADKLRLEDAAKQRRLAQAQQQEAEARRREAELNRQRKKAEEERRQEEVAAASRRARQIEDQRQQDEERARAQREADELMRRRDKVWRFTLLPLY